METNRNHSEQTNAPCEALPMEEHTDQKKAAFASTITNAFIIACAAFLFSPYALRANIARRVLSEKNFAETFQEGKFLNLHQQFNPSYMEASTFKKWINADKVSYAEVKNALKAEKLPYKTLWQESSFPQRAWTIFLGVCGLGSAAVSLIAVRPTGELTEREVLHVLIKNNEEAGHPPFYGFKPAPPRSHPHHHVTDVTAERLEPQLATPTPNR